MARGLVTASGLGTSDERVHQKNSPEVAAAYVLAGQSTAAVLLDDYGHSGHEEQKRAFDGFALSKDVKILTLPTGQGLIIKP